jgi:hypothetical protein
MAESFQLKMKPGFEWSRVLWRTRQSDFCSYCPARIEEDHVPIMLFRGDGHAAQLCDDCIEKYFGIERV